MIGQRGQTCPELSESVGGIQRRGKGDVISRPRLAVKATECQARDSSLDVVVSIKAKTVRRWDLSKMYLELHTEESWKEMGVGSPPRNLHS